MLQVICRNIVIAITNSWMEAEHQAALFCAKYPAIQDHEVIVVRA